MHSIAKALKSFSPRSLLGRFILILLLPPLLSFSIATYIFYERHWDGVSSHMLQAFAGEILYVSKHLGGAPSSLRQSFLEAMNKDLYLQVSFKETPFLEENAPPPQKLEKLHMILSEQLILPFTLAYSQNQNNIITQISLPQGFLAIEATRKRVENSTTYIFILWMTCSAFVFVLIGYLFMYSQLQSITSLSTAAKRFGKGLSVRGFKPSGAKEVRQAGLAFIQMKDRIERFIDQRTAMLAAVSHDLRTPLTRIKLHLALMKKEQATADIASEVSEMEEMITGYLDFARGNNSKPVEQVSLPISLKKIVDDYSLHHPNKITYKEDTKASLLCNPSSFRRMISNILDNALKYGEEISILLTKSSKGMLSIIIDDNGAGIEELHYQDVFKPFYCVESSRGPSSGGTGLGLTIARDIALSYGGNIKLSESPQQGLRVLITLPHGH